MIFNELRSKKLGTPKGLRKFIFNDTDYKTNLTVKSRYINVIELYKGKLVLRTFAYHNVKKSNKYKDIEYQEVCRRIQDEKKILLCNIEASPMAGRRVIYSSSGNWLNDHHEGWVYEASKRNWYFEGYSLYKEDEIIEKLNIKYCQWNLAKKSKYLHMTFFDYICAYIEEPKIELLVKAGYTQYVRHYKKLNFKAKSLDKIFKVNNYWVKYLKKLSYNDLLLIRNKNHRINNYDDLLDVREIYTYAYRNSEEKYIRRYARPCMLKLFESIRNNYSLKIDYEDYLRLCEESDIKITNSVITNKNWIKEHDRLTILKAIKKDKETYQKTFNAYRELLQYVYSNDNLIIIPCESVSDLEKESLELEHCVKTYAKRYMNRETNIFFIRNVKEVTKPYVTLELRNNRVIQVRAKNNNVPEDEVLDFVNNWCNEYKLKNRIA